MRVVLASRSPRRREILSSLGLDFDIVSADVDERSDVTDPGALVKELALRKGRATRALLAAQGAWNDDTLIIACDTVVACEGKILGKPHDRADAARMLHTLSGKAHHVISGVGLFCGEREIAAAEVTAVRFATMSKREIDDYVATGEPDDKAGAYAVQGRASLWIEGLDGCYFNVVGLPVRKLQTLMTEFLGRSLSDLISMQQAAKSDPFRHLCDDCVTKKR